MKNLKVWEMKLVMSIFSRKSGFLLIQWQFAPQCPLFHHYAVKSSTLLHGGNIEKLNGNKSPQFKNWYLPPIIKNP